MYAQGYRNTDRLFLPSGYNVFIAFWTYHYAGEKLGCEVIPGGVLNTEARILKMQEQRATAIGTTPTYALTLADTARRKLNIDPARDLYVRKATVAGEPGGSIPATRRRLEEAWGARVYDQVGSTEAGHFVDAMAIIVILIPIIYPLITKLGYDPIWFGAMVTVLSMIAVITPPVGVNAYVIKGIAKNLPLETIFKGIMPYLTAFFIGIILFMAFPQLATFLPSFLRY